MILGSRLHEEGDRTKAVQPHLTNSDWLEAEVYYITGGLKATVSQVESLELQVAPTVVGVTNELHRPRVSLR
jgi:hypothetical protein